MYKIPLPANNSGFSNTDTLLLHSFQQGLVLVTHLIELIDAAATLSQGRYGYNDNNILNPFQANVPFLYHLKTSENQRFSDVFREYRKGTLAWNGLSLLSQKYLLLVFWINKWNSKRNSIPFYYAFPKRNQKNFKKFLMMPSHWF